MQKRSNIDLKIINKIQDLSQAVLVLKSGNKLVDFLFEAFNEFQFVADVIICLEKLMSKSSNDLSLCKECYKLKKEGNYDLNNCKYINIRRKEYKIFKLKVSNKFIGLIILKISNEEEFLKYFYFINNFLNILNFKLESEKKQEDLLRFPDENINPVIRIIKRSGEIIYINKAASNLFISAFGNSLSTIQKFIPEYKETDSFKMFEKVLDNKTYHFTLISIAGTNYTNIYGIDVTDKKIGENLLLGNAKRYRELFNNMKSGVAVYKAISDGDDFIFIDFNKAAEQIEKIKKKELIGRSVLDVFPGVKQFGLLEVFKRVYKTGNPESYPAKIYKDDRIFGWRENYVYKIASDEIIAIYDDVTEKMQADEEKNRLLNETLLQQKETKALLKGARKILEDRSFKDTARDLFNLCKELIGAKSGYVALLSEDGSENEVLFLDSGGLPCSVDPKLPIPIRGMHGEAYKNGKVVYHNDFPKSKWMKYMPQGHVHLKNVLFAPLIINDKAVGLISIVNKGSDFNENDAKIAEGFGELAAIALKNSLITDSLVESEERLRSTFEQSAVGIAQVSIEGRYLNVNQRLCDIVGYSKEELLRMNYKDLTYQEDSWIDKKHLAEVIEGKIEKFSLEKRYIHKSGKIVWVRLFLSVVSDSQGSIKHVVTVVEDITEQKTAQDVINKLNEELEERVKKRTEELEIANRELESFSYSVSHDLRAPLRHVYSFTTLLFEEIKDVLNQEENAKKYFENIKSASLKMGDLIDDLLAFARISRNEIKKIKINLSDLIKDSQSVLSTELKDRSIEWKISNVGSIKGDLSMLRQVMLNLLSNAIKYTKKKNKAIIEIGQKNDEKEYIIYVKDNGAGFDEKYKGKLFGVFQRLHTDKEFEGTGIGLALVKRIVERHGGRAWAEGNLNMGAIFYFSLPRD